MPPKLRSNQQRASPAPAQARGRCAVFATDWEVSVRMRLSNESRILATLCLADLVSTVVLIKGCGAEEANHVLRFYLAYGVPASIGAKCFLFVPALLIAEHYRPH